MNGCAVPAIVSRADHEVHSDLLGPLSVEAEDTVVFADGLLGFPECRAFALLPGAQEGVYWLQSTDYGPLVFLLIDPFRFFADYAVDLTEFDIAALAPSADGDIAILAIVTLPSSPDESCTANLQGPIALNFRSRQARQLVLPESRFGVRCPVATPALHASH